MNKEFNKVRENISNYSNIIDLIEIADKEYKEIESLNLDKYILHGDLHHGNIVLDNDTYKAIDPYGRIGEKLLEIGAFVMNELWLFGTRDEDIKEVISKIAKLLNEDERFIAKISFIRVVLSTAWAIEENDTRIIQINTDICKRILKIYKIS